MLAARSGLWTAEQYREYLASVAAMLGPGRPGRTWRPLLDTAVTIAGGGGGFGGRGGWMNWRRGADYYDEGDLLWLEVATIIHRESGGKKSIDDFCQEFHGGPNHGPQVKTYTFDELVKTLECVGAVRLGHIFPYQIEFHFCASTCGRNRKRRLESHV